MVALDDQELRIAVVMNGGVSLAVWMGGVTRELDRVRTRDGAYGELAQLTNILPRVDVIAGSSAGGINGAVLAAAIAHGGTVDGIRDLWLDEGAIDLLLRDPLDRDAPSLFRGDERLLAGVKTALEGATGNGSGPPDHPVHCTITGTTINGEVTAYADHFGAVIPDVDHRARFTFRRGEVGAPQGESWPDHFASAVALDQMALAARSSASFPVAFEPSYCPVAHDGSPPGADTTHPNMDGVASFTASRWVIDGGVLVNTPFRPALDAIATLPATKDVRRVLAYVVPDPAAAESQPDDRTKLPAPLTVATDAGSRLPRVQSIGRELEEISENNKEVRRRQRARNCTLRDLDGAELEQAAATFFGTYLCVRREAAVADIVDLVLAGRRDRDYADWSAEAKGDHRHHRIEPWRRGPSIEEVDALRDALSTTSMPWLPLDDRDSAGEELTIDWPSLPIEPWSWGLAPLDHAGNLSLDMLRSAVRRDDMASSRKDVESMRGRLHKDLAELRAIAARNEAFWRAQADLLADPGALDAAMRDWPSQVKGLGEIAVDLAEILADLWELVPPAVKEAENDLRERLETLAAGGNGAPRELDTIVRRMLALDVVLRSSGADISGREQAIDLVLMSADAGNAFDDRTLPEDKLAGLQLHHFGSFYKRSWRANDWMWGRLDGADRLVRTLLDPRRIKQRIDATSAETVRDELRAIAVPDSGLDRAARECLAKQWTAKDEAILTQLEDLTEEPAATALSEVHCALRRRVQLEIVAEEIGEVRRAALADVEQDHTAPDAPGARWADKLPTGQMAPLAACAAFKRCEIGKEAIAGEVGSDFFTKVSTTALGVVGSITAGVSVWKGLRSAQSTVRGVLLSLYLLGRGVVTATKTESFLVALVLALGGALVALFLIGVDIPGVLGLLGSTLLIAGVLLGLVRGTWWRLGLVALAYLAAVAAYYAVRSWNDQPAWVEPVASTAAVVVLALAATALGARGRRGVVICLIGLTTVLAGVATAAVIAGDDSSSPVKPPSPTPLNADDAKAIDAEIAQLRKSADRDQRALGAILEGVAAGKQSAFTAASAWLQANNGATPRSAQLALAAIARGGFADADTAPASPSAGR